MRLFSKVPLWLVLLLILLATLTCRRSTPAPAPKVLTPVRESAPVVAGAENAAQSSSRLGTTTIVSESGNAPAPSTATNSDGNETNTPAAGNTGAESADPPKSASDSANSDSTDIDGAVTNTADPESATANTTAAGDDNPAPVQEPTFVDVTAQAGIAALHRASWNEYSTTEPFTTGYMAVGQAWADYDNDGWLDLYLTGNQAPNALYRNLGRQGETVRFALSDLSASVSLPGLESGGAVWADYDNDGWRDLYVVNNGPNVLYRNVRGRHFQEVSWVAGVADAGKGTSATWGDYDGDGFLDLYVVNWSCYPACDPVDHRQAQDRLYHNQGDGKFVDMSATLVADKLQGAGFAATFFDADNDGDPDLYVVNDKLQNPIGDLFWRNDGPGCNGWCWTDISAESGANVVVNGMGIAVGDYDGDLDQDLYISNMVNPMVLLQNDSRGQFRDVALPARVAVGASNVVGWAPAFLDYDNDGYLDLALATTEFDLYAGTMHAAIDNLLFRNQGTGRFTSAGGDVWPDRFAPSMGIATADFDADGRMDFVTGDWNHGYRLYRNVGTTVGADNNWLTVRLTGGGSINRDAVGAKVYVTTDDGRTQVREVINGSGLGAGHDLALHFGVGQAQVEEVAVVWPNGVTNRIKPVAVNTTLYLSYE